MKCLRRYFCVLLCLVLSLVVFSVGASAQEVAEGYQIYQTHQFPVGTSRGGFTFYPNNGTQENNERVYNFVGGLPSGTWHNTYLITNTNKNVLFEADRKVRASFNNVYYSMLATVYYTTDTVEQLYLTAPTSAYVHVLYTDGTTSNEACTFVKVDDKIINFKLEFTPKKDVRNISFVAVYKDLRNSAPMLSTNHEYDLTFYRGEYNGDDRFQFSFEVSSEEAGLLSGIIDWLKGIWDSIAEIPNKIVEGFAGFFAEITNWLSGLWDILADLPNEIWSYIENGLKSLFVPDDDFIVQFKTDMDTMLSEKLGAVYQVTSLLTTGWDRITANDQQNTVNIPKVTIPLPDNNSFSFGGYNVAIVPSGFEFIVDILKTVIGIVCTILCVNALRKKYDEVMGVEQ